MKTFYRPVDLRSRAEMTGFLQHHFRYPTMNSWNLSTSYACNLKITKLDLEREIEDKLFELMETQEFFAFMAGLRYDFGKEHGFQWQADMNGRSGGYLVLYQGARRRSGYESYCTQCGQKNYQKASDTNCTCGRCGQNSRVNFETPDMQIVIFPGKGTDDDTDFSDWSMDALRERVRLVQSLDQLADRMVAQAIQLCKDFDVQKEIRYVPQSYKVLQKVSAGGGIALDLSVQAADLSSQPAGG